MANSNLKDAKIGAGKGYHDKISMNRVEEGCSIDPEVGVIRIDEAMGKPLSILINFACHPTTMPINNTLISTDFPGEVASVIERVKKEATCTFLQGACGDLNPILTKTGKSEQIQVFEKATVTSTTKNLKLPIRILSLEEARSIMDEFKPKISSENEVEQKLGKFYCEWARSLQKKIEAWPKSWLETEVQAIRIDDIVLVAEPSEMFVEFGLNVKARSPYKKTFIVGYATIMWAIFPTRKTTTKRWLSRTNWIRCQNGSRFNRQFPIYAQRGKIYGGRAGRFDPKFALTV